MKHQPLFLCILGAATLLSLTGYAQKTQDAKTLEERVTALEQELEGVRGALTGLTESNTELAGQLDGVRDYLQQQAKGAKEMLGTLGKAEQLGFVAGINYPSREALLSGWKTQLNMAQEKVPGVKAKPEPEPNGRRSARVRTPR